jgi:hypothetical protein
MAKGRIPARPFPFMTFSFIGRASEGYALSYHWPELDDIPALGVSKIHNSKGLSDVADY